MADNLPIGYSDLLNWAAQNLVRQPDGSYSVAPVYSGATSVNDLYSGIYPSSGQQGQVQASGSGLTSRSVQTYDVDMYGNPIYPSPSVSGSGRTTTAQAGTAQMGAARPAVVDELYGLMGTAQPASGSTSMQPRTTYTLADLMGGSQAASPTYLNTPGQPNNTIMAGKDQAQLSPGGGLSFDPSGNGVLIPQLPRPRPSDAIPVSGGSAPTMAYGAPPPPPPTAPGIAAINAAAPQLPRRRPPTPPSGAPMYQIKRGDTLYDLARRFGTTVPQLANANNIANPNQIKAGGLLNLSYLAPPVPQQRPAAYGGVGNAGTSNARRATAQNDLRESGMLDQFGMIR